MNLLFLLLFHPGAWAVEAQDLPPIEYNRNPYYQEEGYRLGSILNFYRYRIFPWSYEGTMMMGFGAGRQDFIDQLCLDARTQGTENIADANKRQTAVDQATRSCYIFTNPWPFSTLNHQLLLAFEQLGNAQVSPILLHYSVPYISIENIITQTKNFVEGIYPINPDAKIAHSYHISESQIPFSGSLNIKRGFIDGRVVKASLDHLLRKSFEVTIQEGKLGNNFTRMSVDNQEVFNYILAAMLTGKLVHIEYLELIGFEASLVRVMRDYDTPYRVIGVELME